MPCWHDSHPAKPCRLPWALRVQYFFSNNTTPSPQRWAKCQVVRLVPSAGGARVVWRAVWPVVWPAAWAWWTQVATPTRRLPAQNARTAQWVLGRHCVVAADCRSVVEHVACCYFVRFVTLNRMLAETISLLKMNSYDRDINKVCLLFLIIENLITHKQCLCNKSKNVFTSGSTN